jgi:hypothetical protein
VAVKETELNKLKERVQALEDTGPKSWIERHKIWALLISLACLLLAVFTFLEHDVRLEVKSQLTDGLKDPSAKIEKIATEVQTINDTLNDWKEFVLPQVLKHSASLPQDQFDKSLPQLRAAISAARKQDVKISNTVIESLQTKLMASSSVSPDFWPTISQFISYRSIAAFPEEANRLLSQQIPNCVDVAPHEPVVLSVRPATSGEQAQVALSHQVYENCRFRLDSPTDDEKINTVLQHTNPWIDFKNCLVEYRGGPINVILAYDKAPFTITERKPNGKIIKGHTGEITISGPAIRFWDCVFDISVQGPPEPRGQKILPVLLAQNASSISLPVAR